MLRDGCMRSAGGSSIRTVTCVDGTGKPVDSSLCPGFVPASRRRCNLQPCSNCTAAETCRGHGSCAQDGSCACSDGYSGIFCQVGVLLDLVHLASCATSHPEDSLRPELTADLEGRTRT